MGEEKNKILQMVRDGKISVEEGVELLKALEETDTSESKNTKRLKDRFLRVRVDSADTKVNVNIPLSLLKVVSNLGNMGLGLIPAEARREMEAQGLDISKIDFKELMNLIEEGLVDGKIVDVDTVDPKEGRTKVEIYVE